MASLIYIEEPNQWHIGRAVFISLALHALVVIVYPSLTHITLPPMPDKIAVELVAVKAPPPSVQPVSPPVDTPKPIEPAKPIVKPTSVVEKPRPVLAASNSEATYHVPDTPQAKVEPAPPTPTPVMPSTESVSQASTESTSKEAHQTSSAPTSVSADSELLTANDNDAWGDYGEQLRNMVNRSKQYPPIAIRRHLEGDATIVAQFVRGELVQVSLSGSSNHAPLDEEALRMVKKAISELGVKESLKKKSFKITIPVSFKLD